MSDLGETFKALREEQAERRDARVEWAHDDLPATSGAVIFRWINDYHAQAIFRGRVITQWWPSRGKTMVGQRPGDRAKSATVFVAMTMKAAEEQS